MASADRLPLLPEPRSLVLSGGTVPFREPDVRFDRAISPQSYRMSIDDDRVLLVAGDEAGAFYGRATLAQLRHVHGTELPACVIDDGPDLLTRGVMLDISRDRVPTMGTLFDLVDRLASWKVNQLQLYTEHTFAYTGHEEVWRHASPVTAEEIRQLDSYCRARHVELVPNQNTLGHMERWLRHDRYRPLSVSPDGWVNSNGRLRPPSTLDPSNPASLELVRSLLGELLANFESPRVNVGLDEPWELPDDRFGDYLAWVEALRALPELDGREMLIWGDIVSSHPEALERIPEGVTISEWGYDDWHPYQEHTAALAAAGRSFWVCPGTSSWMSILGRVRNMMATAALAVEAALANGASGLLNTDWGDLGHLQQFPLAEPGMAYGAAVSWCLAANRDMDLAAVLDTHVFDDPAGLLGEAVVALGDAYLGITPQFPNCSTLVMNLYFPQLRTGAGFTEGLVTEELAAVEATLDEAVTKVDRSAPRRPDGSLVAEELRAGTALVGLLCRDSRARLAVDGRLGSVPERVRRELADDLAGVIATHRQLWGARNRPGGLDDSTAWLEHLRQCYLTGDVGEGWNGL